MRIGVFVDGQDVDSLVRQVRSAHDHGFASAWAPQVFGPDALTALAVVASQVPGIALGTAVVPTYPRHPMVMAAQARTVQQVSGGRFTLGIGLSHQVVIQEMLGIPWDKPVRHLREHLSILMPLARGDAVSFEGDTLTAKLALSVECDPVPVLVAALGSQMLTVTGRMADGTVTWMTGPRTIASHVAPTIRRAANDHGRPDPRIVVALPVAVTDDPDRARGQAAGVFQIYGQLPSYRAMLDREGAAGPAEVAIAGDAATVRAGIEAVFEAGATEFVAVPFAERQRTLDTLAELLD
ncbi:LLM class F420-dependent oxidoreductase [Rhabdothermincola sediminis]|uniref:LLM class F420-dependent oxidoreductase n=1 Tax=Rhabdothermincola sediminis TaxID=2751370 RepID=UPI001AA0640B|nr:LLM class F420-dependent oxidoreductase [Rhabdothermincola sediminis]